MLPPLLLSPNHVSSQVWTLAAAALGGTIAATVYSRDTAISYGLGAVGGLLYLRLLGRSVDQREWGAGGLREWRRKRRRGGGGGGAAVPAAAGAQRGPT